MRFLKRPDSGTYSIAFRAPNHKRSRVISTGATTIEQAKEIANRAGVARLEILARAGKLAREVVGQIMSTGRKMNDAAVEDWIKWLQYRQKSVHSIATSEWIVRRWLKVQDLLKVPPSFIEIEHISDWVNHKDAGKVATRNGRLAAIRSFMKFCLGQGWTNGDVASLVGINYRDLSLAQQEPRKAILFTDVEIGVLRQAANSFWEALICLGRYQGLRIGDAVTLEWASIDSGKIMLWTRKRNRRIELPIHEEVSKAMKLVIRLNKQYCFPEARTLYLDPKKRAILSTTFRRLCEGQNIYGKTFHGLRHTFASEAVAKGLPIEHLAKDLGHRSTVTTRGYVHD